MKKLSKRLNRNQRLKGRKREKQNPARSKHFLTPNQDRKQKLISRKRKNSTILQSKIFLMTVTRAMTTHSTVTMKSTT